MGYMPGEELGTTGNKVISGLGFKPSRVRFHALSDPTNSADFGTARAYSVDGYMINTPSGIKQFTFSTTANPTQMGRGSKYSACFTLYSAGSASVQQELVAVSFNEDGFTVNCRTANSSNGVMWIAEQ